MNDVIVVSLLSFIAGMGICGLLEAMRRNIE